MATKRVKTDEKPATSNGITTKKKTKKAPASATRTSHQPSSIDRDTRHSLVAAEAYYRAERRGFTAGHELEDWVAAERAIDLRLTQEP